MKKPIILKTRGDYIRGFRKHWRWMHKYPIIAGALTQKWDWPEWKANGGKYPKQKADCFLCEWTCLYRPGELCNKNCPVIWPNGECYSRNNDLYSKWDAAKTSKTRAKYAKQISELPVRRIRK